VLLTAAAYVLMQEMRRTVPNTVRPPGRKSQFARAFSKNRSQVIVTVRRIVLHLPSTAFRTAMLFFYGLEWRSNG